MKKNVCIGMLIIVIILLCYKGCNMNKNINDKEEFISVVQDSLITYKKSNGDLATKTGVLHTKTAKQFIKMQMMDTEIVSLQKLVEEYKSKLKSPGSSATNIKVITKIDTIIEKHDVLVQTLRTDTLYLDTLKEYFFNDEWIEFNLLVGTKTAKLDLTVNNDFDIIIGEDRHWFKKNEAFVELTSKNPYTQTQVLKTYKVAAPRIKRYGIGLHVGYGIGTNLTPQPFIGVGLNYNVFRF